MDNCIFCKIIKGEIPAFKVYEDDDVIAILDRSPVTTGHTLVIPKKHVENVFEMDETTGQKIIAAAIKVSTTLKNKLNLDGLNLHQSNGKVAGQTVFHFHLHLLPRYESDTVNFESPQMDVTPGILEETLKRICSDK